MSTHVFDINVTKAFADVPDNVSLGSLPEQTFTNDKFDNLKCYKITPLVEGQLMYNTTKIFSMLKDPVCHAATPYITLVLGLNFSSLDETATKSVLSPYISDKQAVDMTDALKGQIYKTFMNPPAAGVDSKEKVLTSEEKQRLIADVIFGTDATRTEEISVTASQKFACFVSAFLMRCLVKAPENIINAWAAMKTRFKAFYREDAPAFGPPSKDWLISFKAYLSADPVLGWTWIKAVSKAEDELDVMSPDTGLVRYLAVLPLSYTGLHAYKLFLEIKRVSHLANNWLLKEMVHPMTFPALKEIANLLKTFEPLTTERKSSRFKYARIANSAYFQSLQTKNCPELVYMEVCLLNKYVASGESHQDPGQIVGISRVPAELRERLAEAARRIFTIAPAKNAGMYSQTMANVFLHVQPKKATPGTVLPTADALFGGN